MNITNVELLEKMTQNLSLRELLAIGIDPMRYNGYNRQKYLSENIGPIATTLTHAIFQHTIDLGFGEEPFFVEMTDQLRDKIGVGVGKHRGFLVTEDVVNALSHILAEIHKGSLVVGSGIGCGHSDSLSNV